MRRLAAALLMRFISETMITLFGTLQLAEQQLDNLSQQRYSATLPRGITLCLFMTAHKQQIPTG